jgi:HPt (histidine-containing phosphotransfer) domain-containing protein
MDVQQHEQCAPILDVQDLMARCMGNLQFAERILAKFQVQLSEDLAELERAVSAGDPQRIARVAHRIKGASANVAARGVKKWAADIQEQALQGCLAEVESLLGELRKERSRFHRNFSLTAQMPGATG